MNRNKPGYIRLYESGELSARINALNAILEDCRLCPGGCGVNDLVIGPGGLAVRGLIARHLVLPNGLSGTREVMRFLSSQVPKNTYVNITDRCRPCLRAHEHTKLARRTTEDEFESAARAAAQEGIGRVEGS